MGSRGTIALVAAIGVLLGGAIAPGAARAETPYRNELTFHALALNGYAASSTTIAGSGSAFRLSVGWSGHWYLPYEPPHVVLQRRVAGAAWTTVGDASVSEGGITADAAAVRVPSGLAHRTVDYRFSSLAGATAAGFEWQPSVSSPLRVVYDRQAAYTGLARTAYRAIRRACPAAAVRVTTRLDGDDRAGNYRAGGTLIEIAATVRGYSVPYQRGVALHECAHERQFLNWGATPEGWARMTSAMARRFRPDVAPTGTPVTPSGHGGALPFDPVEHAADCASLSAEPRGYLGYGGWCSPRELRAGRALLAGRTTAR